MLAPSLLGLTANIGIQQSIIGLIKLPSRPWRIGFPPLTQQRFEVDITKQLGQVLFVTKHQLKSAARRTREWRVRHPRKAIQVCKDWRSRNPGWWRGRKYVELLTTALVRGNEQSKVFRDAGMTWDEWTTQCEITKSFLSDSFLSLANGSKLVPIKSWLEFDLNDPAQVKAFLSPGNFTLLQK